MVEAFFGNSLKPLVLFIIRLNRYWIAAVPELMVGLMRKTVVSGNVTTESTWLRMAVDPAISVPAAHESWLYKPVFFG